MTGKTCSLYQGFFFSRFFFIYLTIKMGERNSFVIPRTSLYRASLYRGSTVHMPTPHPSHLHHFEHLHLQFTRSINIVSWGRNEGQNKQRSHLYLRYVFTIVGLVPMLSRIKSDNSIRLLYSSFQFFKTINNNFLLLHG